MTYLLAFDQGTSSSRSIVFDTLGNIVSQAQMELSQIYPQPGWVEHDGQEIWRNQLITARSALATAGIQAQQVHAVGITNQRETTLLWHRKTGIALHNAIVWQDRRTEPLCADLRARGLTGTIQAKTGLPIDAYFSATKLMWLLDHVPGARQLAQDGELAFGTVDSWLIWQLTHGSVHATDVSNASRTMLFNIHSNQWDAELLQALDIPPSLLPCVKPSSTWFGEVAPDLLGAAIPIGGVAGDQQSALFGQACFKPGMIKNTYGTGCFMLLHTGDNFRISNHGLITTSTAQPTPHAEYAMEGSVFVGGAVVQWLRDGLGIIGSSSEVETLAMSVTDSGGVMLVPAFTGLGAPYWRPDVRGTLSGLSRGSTRAHIARAALESIAFQSAVLLQAMSRDAGGSVPVTELRVDGGACANDLLMQFQADLLGIAVVRPTVIETTALGATYLAGLSTGIYQNTDELSRLWRPERRFEPRVTIHHAAELMARWEHAVRQAMWPTPC